MIALENILVATDFGEAADAALKYGRALARMFGGRLHLLHVVENMFLGPMVPDPIVLEARAAVHVNGLLTPEDRETLSARAVTWIASLPAPAIVEYAGRYGINLIVMGTHGRSGMTHLLMGSVAEKVVRTAPCPVLTVKQAPRKNLMIALQNILVPTDFGEAADTALTYGRTLARAFGGTLHVLHVTDDLYVNAFGAESYAAIAPEVQHDVDEAAHKQLNELLADNDNSGPLTRPVILTSGPPALTIAEYAKANDIDLIVMGTHGRGALAHVFMGSVAERVVRIAPCPVLTVRHPEHEFVVPDTLVAVAHV